MTIEYHDEQFYIDWFQDQVINYEDLEYKSESGIHVILNFEERANQNLLRFKCYVVEQNKQEKFHIKLTTLTNLYNSGENKRIAMEQGLFITVLGK